MPHTHLRRWRSALFLALILLVSCETSASRERRQRPAPFARLNAAFTPEQEQHIQRNCGPFGMPKKTWDFGRTDFVTRDQYVLEHSAFDKIALWVAHYLPHEQFDDGNPGSNRPPWKPEPQLPVGVRAEDTDYKPFVSKASDPFDRGHMTPNADFDTVAGRNSTFFLSNVVPQVKRNNQGIWADLEKLVREFAAARGEAYVVTGGFFYDLEDDPEMGSSGGDGVIEYEVIGANEVAVPTHLYKIVLAPTHPGSQDWEAIAFVFENRRYDKPSGGPWPFEEGLQSIDWIEARTGLDFFPRLASDPAVEHRIESQPAPALWQ